MGAGVIGLAVADQLIKAGHSDLAIIEAHSYPGDVTTGRNSGVLHAGIYYPHGSLKHLCCIEGNEWWRKAARDWDWPVRTCGKYVLASDASEAEALDKIYDHALKNGVEGLHWASEKEVSQLKDQVHIHKAFYSANSGVIDIGSVIKRIEAGIVNTGVPIIYDTTVDELKFDGSHFYLKMHGEWMGCKRLINCAGLGAIQLRRNLDLNDFTDYWVKGNYVKLNSGKQYDYLLYPVPPKDLLGLGIHLTIDFNGGVRFGPDTEEVTALEYAVVDERVDKMFPSIQRLFKGVEKADLSPDYSGIRPKIKRTETGDLYRDFLIQGPGDHGIPGYIELLGIESPGLTSAFPLALRSIELIYK